MAELAVVSAHNAFAKECLSLSSPPGCDAPLLRGCLLVSEFLILSEQSFAYQRPERSKHTLYFHLSFSSH